MHPGIEEICTGVFPSELQVNRIVLLRRKRAGWLREDSGQGHHLLGPRMVSQSRGKERAAWGGGGGRRGARG